MVHPAFRQYRNKILLAAGSFLFAVIACEIGLRVMDYTYSPMSIEIREDAQEWRHFHAFSHHLFVYDPKLHWRPKKACSDFNSQGFRGRLLQPEKWPDEFRIFTIGDSNTLGWEYGSSWPAFLHRRMIKLHPRKIVVNAGVYGYSSYQGLKRFEEILDYQPDMVLVSFGSNDGHRVVIPDAEFHAGEFENPIFRTRIGHLIIAICDRIAARRAGAQSTERVPRVSLEEYRRNLEEFIRISEANGVQCVLLTRPYIGASQHENIWKTHAPKYRAVTVEVAREHSVPFIDIYEYFKDKEEFFVDESHFNVDGHRLAAHIILLHLRARVPGIYPDRATRAPTHPTDQ